ncbi:unnamed protein product [Protopolystoma xenopodis]|uniref:Uncharacterized protein n=1 Tax=Protopolystoma xenopodis TaxID=117903 RepID=A0A3S5A7J6_9PLAT|nr:unnamed protein product [Protopolystoma xenopodis]
MLSEQTADAHLWSHASSQVDFKYILAITPNFRDVLLICLPSSLTARPPKLYWFIRAEITQREWLRFFSSRSLFLRLALDPRSRRLLFAGLAPFLFSPNLLKQWAKLSLTLPFSNLMFIRFFSNNVTVLPNLALPCVVTEWCPFHASYRHDPAQITPEL